MEIVDIDITHEMKGLDMLEDMIVAYDLLEEEKLEELEAYDHVFDYLFPDDEGIMLPYVAQEGIVEGIKNMFEKLWEFIKTAVRNIGIWLGFIDDDGKKHSTKERLHENKKKRDKGFKDAKVINEALEKKGMDTLSQEDVERTLERYKAVLANMERNPDEYTDDEKKWTQATINLLTIQLSNMRRSVNGDPTARSDGKLAESKRELYSAKGEYLSYEYVNNILNILSTMVDVLKEIKISSINQGVDNAGMFNELNDLLHEYEDADGLYLKFTSEEQPNGMVRTFDIDDNIGPEIKTESLSDLDWTDKTVTLVISLYWDVANKFKDFIDSRQVERAIDSLAHGGGSLYNNRLVSFKQVIKLITKVLIRRNGAMLSTIKAIEKVNAGDNNISDEVVQDIKALISEN